MGYLTLNPELSRHPLYRGTEYDYKQKAFTRIRFYSQRLNIKVHVGRWSTIKIETRLYQCGIIQTEDYLLYCEHTESIRDQYRMLNVDDTQTVMQSTNM